MGDAIRPRRTLLTLVALLAAACTATPQASTPGPGASPTPSSIAATRTASPTGSTDEPLLPIAAGERAQVRRITDGDTIVIDRGNGEERLRYIGMDTPESVKPGSPVESLAREAAAANEALVGGREVLLERDVSEVDQFDRLLRYVWVEDASQPSGWLMVNLELVERGYAQAATYPPDVRYAELFLEAQRMARAAGLGLWADAESAPATPLPLTGGAGRSCDPAYPDVCIPPSPPDLDCRDITFTRFRVLQPDPHRFDGNGDGVGCEGPPQ